MKSHESDLKVEVRGDLIIVEQPSLEFLTAYFKAPGEPQLKLKSRTSTNDHALLAQVYQAAVNKARELGWIV